MARCIWCKGETTTSAEEHVFPEALGTIPNMVLRDGVVCTACNNGLAYLDQAVAHEFDFPAFWFGVRRKGNRPIAVDSRGNVRVSAGERGSRPGITVPATVVPAGENKSGRPRKRRDLDVAFELPKSAGDEAFIHFTYEFGTSPRFVRGILKIGLSCVAFFDPEKGASLFDGRFDAAREFVVNGRGVRHVALLAAKDLRYQHFAYPPMKTEQGYPWCLVRIGMVEFYVDLSNESLAHPLLVAEIERLRPGEVIVLPQKSLAVESTQREV